MGLVTIPSGFYTFKHAVTRAPVIDELDFIYNWCAQAKPKKIIEVGCGMSTCALFQGANVDNTIISYVGVESEIDRINVVNATMPSINIVSLWSGIPNDKYDLLFVDSADGSPDGKGGRLDVIKANENLISVGGSIMLHDFFKRTGGPARDYLNGNSKYKLTNTYSSTAVYLKQQI